MKKLQEYEKPPDGYFTCAVCGCHFEPDPRTVCESGISPVCENGCDCDAGEVEGEIPSYSIEEFMEMSKEELASFGLTPEHREAMLRGEEIGGLATIICLECQDKALTEQEGNA